MNHAETYVHTAFYSQSITQLNKVDLQLSAHKKQLFETCRQILNTQVNYVSVFINNDCK